MRLNETFEMAYVDAQRINETSERGYITTECDLYTFEEAKDVLEIHSFRVIEDFSTLNLRELAYYLEHLKSSETINMAAGEYFLCRDHLISDDPLVSFTDEVELESLMNCYIVVCTEVTSNPTHNDIQHAVGEL